MRIFDTNPDEGVIRFFHYDNDTDEVTIETVQDVSPIIQANRAEFDAHTSLDRFGDLKRVASIPMPLYFQLKAEGKTEDQDFMRRWLNDPDNRFFRTCPGRV